MKALVLLRDVAFDDEEGPIFCKWQVAGDVDVAAYCNVNTYLETLDDLLANGQWVDRLSFDDVIDDTDASEQLFRFYGLTLLVIGEVLSDLRLMHKSAETRGKLGPEAGRLLGFINEIWKHRGGSQQTNKSGRVFHRDLHHGPYFFVDVPSPMSEQTGDSLFSADNLDIEPSRMAGLLVPSLVSSIRILGEEVHRVGQFLDDPTHRQILESRWGLDLMAANE